MKPSAPVLVTGADGFIGSHLAEILLQGGHTVSAICRYKPFASRDWLDHSLNTSEIEIIIGDVQYH